MQKAGGTIVLTTTHNMCTNNTYYVRTFTLASIEACMGGFIHAPIYIACLLNQQIVLHAYVSTEKSTVATIQ